MDNAATDLFSEWADIGRDEGMEKGHAKRKRHVATLA